MATERCYHRGPVGGIMKKLLLALVTAVILSAVVTTAALTPSPSGDSHGHKVWILDSCDQLTDLRTSVGGIVVIGDITCSETRVSYNNTYYFEVILLDLVRCLPATG